MLRGSLDAKTKLLSGCHRFQISLLNENSEMSEKNEYFFALKLSFDSCLIYNRPDLPDLLSPKFIEDILGKGDSLPVDMEPKKRSFWRTVEPQPARYVRRVGNQQQNVERKVRNCIKISLQHLAIPFYPDPLAVVGHVIMNEPFQLRPVLLIQTGNVASVDGGKISFHHGNCSCASAIRQLAELVSQAKE